MSNNLRNMLQLLKPGVPKRALFFVAAMLWSSAGGILLFRGTQHLCTHTDWEFLGLTLIFVGGVLFYYLIFDKIATKHLQRIGSLKEQRPCLFSFFDLKSYLIMAVMITLGVLIRKSAIIPPTRLALFYLCMATPLSISAIRLFIGGIKYKEDTAPF